MRIVNIMDVETTNQYPALLRQGQRLPNECLYLIVEHCTALPTLKNLLLVNKFFFHATIPYLYHSPLITWDMNYVSPEYATDRDKLFALYIVSFLQARLEEHQWNGDEQEADKILAGILKPFGLMLTRPYQSSGLDMLDTIASRLFRPRHIDGVMSSEWGIYETISDSWKNHPQRLSMDYSKFLTDLELDDWRFFPFYSVFRLRKIPESMRPRREDDSSSEEEESDAGENNVDENGMNGNDTDESSESIMETAMVSLSLEDDAVDEEIRGTGSGSGLLGDEDDNTDSEDGYEGFSFDVEREHAYTWPLRESLADLWLHYNFDTITSFGFEMAKAEQYLPLSTKMAKLEIICLYREIAMPDSHLENTILFINQNQDAFPKKKPINATLSFNWNLYNNDVFDRRTMDLNTYRNECKKQREILFRHIRPAIEIYKAVKRPNQLDVSEIPNFYEYAKDIELEELKELIDGDLERISSGEGLIREDFLRRCDNLRELRLGVESHDIFSWLVEEIRNSAPLSAKRPLKKIKTLKLWNCDLYNFAVQAFNDAMYAFSESLQTIDLSVRKDYSGNEIPNVVRNARVMESLMLHKRTSAITIGDWPALLPWLKEMTIHLDGVACINFGSLDQCPNLETLEITFRCKAPVYSRPEGDAPTTFHDSDELLDQRWIQAKMDYTLFPTWNLPRLKQLTLHGMAALRFDVASLLGMRHLETLEMKVNREMLWDQTMDEYINRQRNFQGLHLPNGSDYKPGYNNASFERDTAKTCILPELKTMTLDGPPSAIFYLDLLKSLPKLESVHLDGISELREISRHRVFQTGTTTPQNYCKDTDLTDTRPQDGEVEGTDDEAPYLESRLRELVLDGGWTISAEDTTSLLTIYAPFLERLMIGPLRTQKPHNGYKFLEAIMDADYINNLYTEDSDVDDTSDSLSLTARQPGRNLITVECRYTIRKRELWKLGFVRITYEDHLMLKHCGIRTYYLLNQFLARSEDVKLAKKKNQLDNDSQSERIINE